MKFAPKPHKLTETENPSSFETWKDNLIFHLTMDGSFEEFLEDNYTWNLASVAHRGLSNDPAGEGGKTAKQKEALLQLMLGSIASYAPVIPRKFVTREALSLTEIWNRLRTHYGFRKSGALILDLASFTNGPNPGESHEMLWERLYSFLDDNLMFPGDGIKHLGLEPIGETMSPTLLNVCVVLWLHCIHSGLPALVKQRYASELRNKSLASLREEISESLNALLAELTGENAAVSRMSRPYKYQSTRNQSFGNATSNQKNFCILCSTNNRQANHYLSTCTFVPESDRKFMRKSWARGIEVQEDDEYIEPDNIVPNTDRVSVSHDSQVRRVDVEHSPVLFAEYGKHYVPLTIDCGAESNLIKKSFANYLGVPIQRTTCTASQADGKSNLKIVGEVHCNFKFRNIDLKFNGLVAESLQDDVIAGMPFQATNDVYPRPAHKKIYIGDKEVVKYNTSSKQSHTNKNNRIVVDILRVPSQTTLYPGDSISFDIPTKLKDSEIVALEPRMCSPSMMNEKPSKLWLKPDIVKTDDGKVKLLDSSEYPVLLTHHEQICNVRPVTTAQNIPVPVTTFKPDATVTLSETTDYKGIEVDPAKSLSTSTINAFHDLHYKYRSVFDTRTIGCYNGASGPFKVVINMGPSLPPQRKGRLPLYNRSTFEELQAVCDELDGTVFMKPEDIGVTAEYLNPSFLVKKPSGKKRLVTAFSEVGQYAKPQPALMSNVNDVFRTIGNWKFLIKTDLTKAYWQIPLSKESMKFCGIVTPFKGVRVYTRGAMGMPGTETALEELLSRILGDLITEGGVTKIADDLYVGASSPEALLQIWEKVLIAMEKNGLRLSPTKTVCCPSTVTILGWIWNMGTIQASPSSCICFICC